MGSWLFTYAIFVQLFLSLGHQHSIDVHLELMEQEEPPRRCCVVQPELSPPSTYSMQEMRQSLLKVDEAADRLPEYERIKLKPSKLKTQAVERPSDIPSSVAARLRDLGFT